MKERKKEPRDILVNHNFSYNVKSDGFCAIHFFKYRDLFLILFHNILLCQLTNKIEDSIGMLHCPLASFFFCYVCPSHSHKTRKIVLRCIQSSAEESYCRLKHLRQFIMGFFNIFFCIFFSFFFQRKFFA